RSPPLVLNVTSPVKFMVPFSVIWPTVPELKLMAVGELGNPGAPAVGGEANKVPPVPFKTRLAPGFFLGEPAPDHDFSHLKSGVLRRTVPVVVHPALPLVKPVAAFVVVNARL